MSSELVLSALESGRVDQDLLNNLTVMGDNDTVLVSVRLRDNPALETDIAKIRSDKQSIQERQDAEIEARKKYVKASQDKFLPKLSSKEFKLRHRLQVVNAFSAQMTRDAIMRLLNDTDVALRHLRVCLEHDTHDTFRKLAEKEPDLKSLRSTANYSELMHPTTAIARPPPPRP